MVKRVLLVAIIVAAILVVAAPALAFNGYRERLHASPPCAMCHTDTPGIPQGLHRVGADASTARTLRAFGLQEPSVRLGLRRLPHGELRPQQGRSHSTTAHDQPHRGGLLGGCNGLPVSRQHRGAWHARFSSGDIGCSSCHYNSDRRGPLVPARVQHTAHTAAPTWPTPRSAASATRGTPIPGHLHRRRC